MDPSRVFPNIFLSCFVAVSGLKVNLSNLDIVPVGEAANIDSPTSVLVCKIGVVPSTYMGLPLESFFKEKQYGTQ